MPRHWPAGRSGPPIRSTRPTWRCCRIRPRHRSGHCCGSVSPTTRSTSTATLASFAWMELGLALESRADVHLTEEDMARVETLRDLVRLCVERRAGAPSGAGATALATDTERWLAPTGVLLTAAGFALYGLNW